LISDAGLSGLVNLTVLDLSCNNAISDDGISALLNLTSLGLARNGMITNRGLQGLRHLVSVNLAMNDRISDECIGEIMTNLKSLNLACNNRITNSGISRLTALSSLSLSGAIPKFEYGDIECDIDDIGDRNEGITSEGLRVLTSLTSLDLSHYASIEDGAIERLVNLTSLDISYNNGRITKDSLTCLTNLQSLIFTHNSDVSAYVASPFQLTSLTFLDVSEPGRSLFVRQVSKLTNLLSLCANGYRLVHLGNPKDFGQLSHLTSLEMSSNYYLSNLR
jgi:Leucine-rich repeat (LRR) protein